jgi:hypothetical protein
MMTGEVVKLKTKRYTGVIYRTATEQRARAFVRERIKGC